MKFLIVLALIVGAFSEELEHEFPIVEPEEHDAYLIDEHQMKLNDESELLMEFLYHNALPERFRGEDYFKTVVCIKCYLGKVLVEFIRCPIVWLIMLLVAVKKPKLLTKKKNNNTKNEKMCGKI